VWIYIERENGIRALERSSIVYTFFLTPIGSLRTQLCPLACIHTIFQFLLCSTYSFSFKIEASYSLEMVVEIYWTTLYHIPAESIFQKLFMTFVKVC
jgi:hypothetical protein